MFTDPQRGMLDRAIANFSTDGRFDALLACGSLAGGGFDAHSDFDFVIVVSDDAYSEVMSQRRALAAGLGSLLTAFTGELVGEPRLMICLYGPPLLHVDLKFLVAADLDALKDHPVILWARQEQEIEARIRGMPREPSLRDAQWFEDRIWTWLHYGAVKLARGEHFEAIGTIEFMREKVLGPMLQRNAGKPQRGTRRMEEIEGAPARLLPTLASYDPASIRDALKATAGLYVELRDADPPSTLVTGMPQLIFDFIDRAR